MAVTHYVSYFTTNAYNNHISTNTISDKYTVRYTQTQHHNINICTYEISVCESTLPSCLENECFGNVENEALSVISDDVINISGSSAGCQHNTM